MTVKPVIIIPDPVLKQKALTVGSVNEDVRTLMNDMLETMYNARGIGLAANQVGLLARVLVMDVSHRERDGGGVEGAKPIFMANPEIIAASESISVMEEGCLSIPGQYAEVERPAIVRVRYLDYDNKVQELEAEGLLSHCVQHEIDHLNGMLFIDHLSTLKRNMIIKKFKKAQKNADVM